jgi:ParB family transcriptional regulator, chromosome partitioning protein
MQLSTIALDNLSISPVNMRHNTRPPDISDILPSVKARGVLVPLLVRPNGKPDHFEIVAGRRRYFAAKQALAELADHSSTVETAPDDQSDVESTNGVKTSACGTIINGGHGNSIGSIDFTALPCAILDDSDDAAALEASLIENIARLSPSEIEQYETFVRLTKEGRSVAQIALTFGITERMVHQRLALGNLNPRIRKLYARDEIDNHTLQLLTLATKSQQMAWLKLADNDDDYAPEGQALKKWLFGGAPISTQNALFRREAYTGPIITDLFGTDEYFADSDLFWTLQDAMIDERVASLREAGWQSVQILERGERFHNWQHIRTPKNKGGRAYLTIGHDGTVEEHLGYLTEREVRQQAKGNNTDKSRTAKPEMSAPMANYVALYRHAAVRLEVANNPRLALRMAVASLLCGDSRMAGVGGLHGIADPQKALNDQTAASLAQSPATSLFRSLRQSIVQHLGCDLPDEEPNNIPTIDDGDVATSYFESNHREALFRHLVTLDDPVVYQLLALLVAECMSVADPLVEILGTSASLTMSRYWQADEAFLDLLRDKATINAMLAEVAGEAVAAGNAKETGKVQKGILRDCLEGRNSRAAPDTWVPRWLRFPKGRYATACTV